MRRSFETVSGYNKTDTSPHSKNRTFSLKWLTTEVATGAAVRRKAADIVIQLTDRKYRKVFHVYPNNQFTEMFNKYSNFIMEGLTDSAHAADEGVPEERISHTFDTDWERESEADEDWKAEHWGSDFPDKPRKRPENGAWKHYSKVLLSPQLLNPNLDLSWEPKRAGLYLKDQAYEMVVQCLPALDEQPGGPREGLGVLELARILRPKGYLVLGAPAEEFERKGYKEQLLALSDPSTPSHLRGQLQVILKVRPEGELPLTREQRAEAQAAGAGTGGGRSTAGPQGEGQGQGQDRRHYYIAVMWKHIRKSS